MSTTNKVYKEHPKQLQAVTQSKYKQTQCKGIGYSHGLNSKYIEKMIK